MISRNVADEREFLSSLYLIYHVSEKMDPL